MSLTHDSKLERTISNGLLVLMCDYIDDYVIHSIPGLRPKI